MAKRNTSTTGGDVADVAEMGAGFVYDYWAFDNVIAAELLAGPSRTAAYKANKAMCLDQLASVGLVWTRGMITRGSATHARKQALTAFRAQIAALRATLSRAA